MGDNPFKEPASDTQSNPPSRARYGGVAPIYAQGGEHRDPYFTPRSNQPSRTTPQVAPGFRPGGDPDGQPAPTPRQTSPDLRPDDSNIKFRPKTPANWHDQQPGYDGTSRTAGQTDLERVANANKQRAAEARQPQHGSGYSYAILGALAAPLTQPIVKLGDVTAGKLMKPGQIKPFASVANGTLDRLKGARLVSSEKADQLKTAVNNSRLGKVSIETGPGTRARSVGEWYKRNYTTVGYSEHEISKQKGKILDSARKWEESFDVDRQVLAKFDQAKTAGSDVGSLLSTEEKAYIDKLTRGIQLGDKNALSNGVLEDILRKRQAMMNPVEEVAAGGAKVWVPTHPTSVANASTLLEEINNTRHASGATLFTAEEAKLVQEQVGAFKKINTLNETALAAEATGETKWFSAGGLAQNAKKGFLYTGGTASLLFADQSFRDFAYGKDFKSWGTSSLAVPLALALAGGGKNKWANLAVKGGAGILAAGGGQLLDHIVPVPGNGTPWQNLAKDFTAFDAGTLAIAFTVPSKTKIAAITTAVVAGKTLDALFYDNKGAGGVEDKAAQSTKDDISERSYSSMERSIKAWKALGEKNEPMLEMNQANLIIDSQKNWSTMTHEQKLNSYRATIAVSKALGELHLDHGTKLSPAATDGPTYVLNGLNLDMGGDALNYLRLAQRNVSWCKDMTNIMIKKGESANGSKVRDGEVKDLDSIADKVNGDINAIYGKHDIEAAFLKLKKFIDKGETADSAILNKELAYQKTFGGTLNTSELDGKLARNYAAYSANPDSDQGKFLAKLYRDKALALMSYAGYKLDHANKGDPIGAKDMLTGSGQGRQTPWLDEKGQVVVTDGNGQPLARGWDGVADLLQRAKELDPNNQDMPELVAIWERLAKDARDNEPQQWENFDILGVRNGLMH